MSTQNPLYYALKEIFGSKPTISYSDCDMKQLRKLAGAVACLDEEFKKFNSKNPDEEIKVHTWCKKDFYDAFGDLLNRHQETWAGFTISQETKMFRDVPSMLFKKDISAAHPDLYGDVFDAGNMDETGDKLNSIITNARNAEPKKRGRPPSSDLNVVEPPKSRDRINPDVMVNELSAGDLKQFLLAGIGTRFEGIEKDVKKCQADIAGLDKAQANVTERQDEFDSQLSELTSKVNNFKNAPEFLLRNQALKFIQAKKQHRHNVFARCRAGVFRVSTSELKFLTVSESQEVTGFNVGALRSIINERFEMIPGTMQCRTQLSGKNVAKAKFRLMGSDQRAPRLISILTNKRAKYDDALSIGYPDG